MQRENQIIKPQDFISIKGVFATGNQLSKYSIKTISIIEDPNYMSANIEEVKNIDLPEDEVDNTNSGNIDNQIKLNF